MLTLYTNWSRSFVHEVIMLVECKNINVNIYLLIHARYMFHSLQYYADEKKSMIYQFLLNVYKVVICILFNTVV